ncbi:MAG: DUF2971 domain-containing protein [Gammaproteobacteria bacterium AqS3]|nr:DUF2971 domain-containing protein [Gammaproteobacteria bacterium AqS3]
MNKDPEQKLTKFYKYMPAESAINSLKNETLRWSSPLCFNDPFDVPRELAEGMKFADIAAAKWDVLKDYLSNYDAPIDDLHPHFQKMIIRYRNLNDTGQNLPPQENNKDDPSIKVVENAMKAVRKHWCEYLLPRFRILCLSARKDIVPMWHHYADEYQGVVLEFDSCSGASGLWSKIRRVEYPHNPPELFTEKGWSHLIILSPEKQREKIQNFHLYTKKPDWEYEQEYRLVIINDRDSENIPNYSDWKLPKENITNIYFGPKISVQNKQLLMSLISEKLPHAQTYGMSFKFGWKIQFEKACG